MPERETEKSDGDRDDSRQAKNRMTCGRRVHVYTADRHCSGRAVSTRAGQSRVGPPVLLVSPKVKSSRGTPRFACSPFLPAPSLDEHVVVRRDLSFRNRRPPP